MTNEVLPSIGETGQYVHHREVPATLTPQQLADLKRDIRYAFWGWVLGNYTDQWFYNRIRTAFNIHRFEDLPAGSRSAIKPMIDELEKMNRDFLSLMCELRDRLFRPG